VERIEVTDARKLKEFIYRAINRGADAACVSLDVNHADKDKLFLSNTRFTAARNQAADELMKDFLKLTGAVPVKIVKPKKGKKQNGTTPLPSVRAGRVRVARIPGAKE
jgi:hypothetical protein